MSTIKNQDSKITVESADKNKSKEIVEEKKISELKDKSNSGISSIVKENQGFATGNKNKKDLKDKRKKEKEKRKRFLSFLFINENV